MDASSLQPQKVWACTTTTWYDGTSITDCYDAPPSSPPSGWDVGYDPCAANPSACGGSSGAAPAPAPGYWYNSDAAYANDTPLPVTSPWIADEYSTFDCRVIVCPSPSAILVDANVQTASAVLQRASIKDGLEHGAFLFLRADGTIRVGEIFTGSATRMPQLARAPSDAIGSIHSHPLNVPPSGSDGINAYYNNIYVTVVTVGWMYLIDPNGHQIATVPRFCGGVPCGG